MSYQNTISTTIKASGIGLHSGEKISLKLRPAKADTGIVFRRTDIEPHILIPALSSNVGNTTLSTTIECNGAKVSTVEHLLSAFVGLGIDNAIIDLDSAEVPIMDGSAAPFVFLLQSAGLKKLNTPRKYFRILKPIEVQDGSKWAKFEPYEGYKVSFEIEFDHPIFNQSRQFASYEISQTSFIKDISRARTFGFMHEVEELQKNGFARGGSLNNAIVMDNFRILNESGLRFDDEFVKHKILDAIGDLFLLGHPLKGAFSAYRSGHRLNNQLLGKVLQTKDAWEIVSADCKLEDSAQITQPDLDPEPTQ